MQENKLSYQIPPAVEDVTSGKLPLLTTPAGGRVIVDARILALWKKAAGHSLDSLLAAGPRVGASTLEVRAALACLAEAGLLARQPEERTMARPVTSVEARVSVVIVGYNSREWLAGCLASLFAQTLTPQEIILVDNGSTDGSVAWTEENYPLVKVLHAQGSLAGAINLGVVHASGDYFLMINPDVELAPDALAQLAAVARQEPACAAVAAKLKLLWTPGFLNGLGNFVGALSWGADIGLGQLDLGQFDDCEELPSACFAAALIPAAAWRVVGPLDENFPMYYEDNEWCYRARLLGYHIRAAPQAIVYHAFSGRAPSGEESRLTPEKLYRVAYGRLRFAGILPGSRYRVKFTLRYFMEDTANVLVALVRGQWDKVRAYGRAYRLVFRHLPEIRRKRAALQPGRRIEDDELFRLQRSLPRTWMRSGMPMLTWDLVSGQYLALVVCGRTRSLPEVPAELLAAESRRGWRPGPSWLRRAGSIWQAEGASALLYRAGKWLQWKLMQP